MSPRKGKDTIRAFIAVDVPPPVQEALGELQRGMEEAGLKARWPRPQDVHVTLAFLGNVPSEQVPELRAAMEEAAQGAGPLEVHVGGVGAFPNERWPRVIWVGFEEPTGGLAALHKRLEAALVPLGYEPEDRPFRPHLTVARIKVPARAGQVVHALEAHKDVDLGKITIDRIVLYQSTLKPTGPAYTVLEEVALGG
ncbi:MAG: RNA 2',3'-cyclic phosphodiesterase [bacterium]|nr:RNA 2',3'-cyclic phosphodiesterase [bacterium]